MHLPARVPAAISAEARFHVQRMPGCVLYCLPAVGPLPRWLRSALGPARRFTHDELKRHFPDSYREMKSDFQACKRQVEEEQRQEQRERRGEEEGRGVWAQAAMLSLLDFIVASTACAVRALCIMLLCGLCHNPLQLHCFTDIDSRSARCPFPKKYLCWAAAPLCEVEGLQLKARQCCHDAVCRAGYAVSHAVSHAGWCFHGCS